MKYQTRAEIPEAFRWDLTKLYENEEAWENDYLKTKKETKKILKYAKEDILSKPELLYEVLECYFGINARINELSLYANLKSDEDLSNNHWQTNAEKISFIWSVFSQNAAFIYPAIKKGSKAKLKKLMESKKLKKYRFYLEDLIRYKPHLLNEENEIIVNKLTETMESYEMMSTTLIDSVLEYGSVLINGEKTQITNANFHILMKNPDAKVRKESHELFTGKLKEFENIFATSLIANMKLSHKLAGIYNYKTMLERDLFGSNIPIEVYNNLFEVVEKRVDVFQKYFLMIKTHLGLDKLNRYDTGTELVNSDMEFSIDEAKLLVLRSLEVLGDEYISVIEKAFNERWIDFENHKGKRSGAYAASSYKNNSFILLNYYNKFEDISALAHELGHAINFYFTEKNTYYHESELDMFNIEIPPLVNEVLLSDYIIKNSSDKELKLTAIYNLLNTIQNNLFGSCILGEFEHNIYGELDKEEAISLDSLNEGLHSIKKKYYGSSIDLSDSVEIMWAAIPHFFSPYYNYKYAIGVSSAVYISKKIINNQDNMRNKFLDFLTKGSTNYADELLKEINVDLSKPEVINDTIDFMDYLIDEFNKISEEEN